MFAEIKQRAVYWINDFIEWYQRRIKNETHILFRKKQGNDVLWKKALPGQRVTKKLIDMTEGYKLWMSNYSAKQLSEYGSIIADDDYMHKAQPDDYCFVEDKTYSIDGVSEMVLCHWNRKYPSDKFFEIDLKKEGFKKTSTEDIKGSSHKKITIEVWRAVI